MSTDNLNPNSLRLCHIYKWDSFDGYGFNLHAEKGKPGQYIGKVDEGSPAESAGLKEGDRIIEVNGINIANENHKQVVTRIKSLPDSTKLLVVDPEGDSYFKSNNITINGDLSSVLTLTTGNEPVNNSDSDNKNSEDTQSNKSGSGRSSEYEISSTTQIITEKEKDKTNKNSHLDNTQSAEEHHNSLNLNMTAKELRAQLAAKKKYDPKKDSLDFKKKYDIVQKL